MLGTVADSAGATGQASVQSTVSVDGPVPVRCPSTVSGARGVSTVKPCSSCDPPPRLGERRTAPYAGTATERDELGGGIGEGAALPPGEAL